MKKGILLSLLLLSSQAYSYQFNDGNNFVLAELLVWKLREVGNEDWAQTISPSGITQSAKLINAPFQWDPGFKVGIGRISCNDIWDASLVYTHFDTKGSRSVNAPSGGVYSGFDGNFFVNNPDGNDFGPNYKNAGIDWKFYYDTFDLIAGFTFPIDSVLILKPTFGLKGAIIHQTLYSQWENPTVPTTFTTGKETLKQNFWGIGPTIGLETIWPIKKVCHTALNLFGNITGGILAGKWEFSENYLNTTPTSVTVNLDNLVSASTLATGIVGLEWIGNYQDMNIIVQLGYEAQVWFNHVQYYSFSMGRLDTLMSLQGGVLDLYVNF